MSTKKKVEIYSTTFCPYCVKAKELLKRKGVEFTEINVDNDIERQKMLDRTGGARSVPQIFVDDEFLAGGCDGLFERERADELDKILGLS